MSKVPKHRTDEEKKAVFIGSGMTVIVHASILLLFVNTGLKTVYPPPAEEGILIEFEQEPPKPIMVETGREPRQEIPKPDEDVKLVQRAEAAEKGSEAQAGVETTMGEEGDVEKYEAPRPKPIDQRALFTSAINNRDTLAAQTAKKVSDALKAGHPDGNTLLGNTDNTPTARLAGRSIVGTLPNPEYSVNKSGKVVVKIMVDQYGTVTNAIPGEKGTTVQDKTLWEAAKKAALNAKFNTSSNAPVVQEGTITYIFILK